MNKKSKLLSVNNLSVSFDTQNGLVDIINGVSFDIYSGENLAIVGESGSGKSVTALSILRLHEEANTIYGNGSIDFQGKNLLTLREAEIQKVRGKNISMIFQEPMTSLNPVFTVGQQIEEVLTIHQDLNKGDKKNRVIELLERVGIRQPEQKVNVYPHSLSGGQRQRIMIAMALACDPALLIADEPTTALDVTIQQQILDLLLEIQKDTGMSVLLITHDLNLVRRFANRVCVMQDGKIVESNETNKLFSEPQNKYTKFLLDSEPDKKIATSDAGEEMVFNTKNLRCYFPIYKGFFKRKVDEVKAVDDVTLSLRSGETLGIVGESGSGKTTLGLAMFRLLSSQGEIYFKNKNVTGFSEKQLRPLRRYFQIVFQDPFSSLSPRMTVRQIIEEGLKLHYPQLNSSQRLDKILAILYEVGLDESALWRYPHEFSGGQRQRIAIARTVVLEPDVILLDEPTSALDVSVQKQVLGLLADLQQKRQLSYLFISHDLRVVRAMSHRVIVMREGRIVEEGNVDDVFDNPEHDYTRELASASLYHS
ncbi:MAG: microcin ABC transporter ATP-binding protein [Gammaproteobacteria bacterium]|nr:MAG: microcin ABC transporter ATP-binding protein [Gammaproteobacteria bacterium]